MYLNIFIQLFHITVLMLKLVDESVKVDAKGKPYCRNRASVIASFDKR
jgi:hypothetical protein